VFFSLSHTFSTTLVDPASSVVCNTHIFIYYTCVPQSGIRTFYFFLNVDSLRSVDVRFYIIISARRIFDVYIAIYSTDFSNTRYIYIRIRRADGAIIKTSARSNAKIFIRNFVRNATVMSEIIKTVRQPRFARCKTISADDRTFRKNPPGVMHVPRRSVTTYDRRHSWRVYGNRISWQYVRVGEGRALARGRARRCDHIFANSYYVRGPKVFLPRNFRQLLLTLSFPNFAAFRPVNVHFQRAQRLSRITRGLVNHRFSVVRYAIGRTIFAFRVWTVPEYGAVYHRSNLIHTASVY